MSESLYEESARLVKLDGCSKACKWCGKGLQRGWVGHLIGYCSPSCRDLFIEANTYDDARLKP